MNEHAWLGSIYSRLLCRSLVFFDFADPDRLAGFPGLKAVLPLAFLFAGIKLLTSTVVGWSIILGLPLTIMGMVWVIYLYDEIITKQVDRPEEKKPVLTGGQPGSKIDD